MEILLFAISLMAILGLITGVYGLFKGKVPKFHISNRRTAALVLLLSVIVIGMLPNADGESDQLEPVKYTIDIVVEGEGTVLPKPGSHLYTQGEQVDIQARPEVKHLFSGWQGDITGENNPITITITGDMTIKAVFTPKPKQVVDDHDSPRPVFDDLKVHVIDVGQGLSVFVVGPDGRTMLYDAGGDGDVGNIITTYIKSLGHTHIDVAVFTHPHADHINGAPTIFEQLDVRSVYYSGAIHTTVTFERFLSAIEDAGLSLKRARTGMKIPFGPVEAIIVAPAEDEYDKLNDYSVAIKLTYQNNTLLLMGDNESLSEREMVSGPHDINVDVLLVAHHGSNSSSTLAFLQATVPQYAIISTGRDNRYGHPHQEVLQRLDEVGCEIYVTAEVGTVIALFDGYSVRFNTVPLTVEPKDQGRTQPGEKVNINTADFETLQKITGVGETIARSIIDYRKVHGPFQSIGDIKQVFGIGDARFEIMKDEITVGD